MMLLFISLSCFPECFRLLRGDEKLFLGLHGRRRRNSGCRKKGCARLPADPASALSCRQFGFDNLSAVSRFFDFHMTTSRPTSRCGTPPTWWLGGSVGLYVIWSTTDSVGMWAVLEPGMSFFIRLDRAGRGAAK